MQYNVKTFRDAGLQAKWTRTRAGSPIISCRDFSAAPWYVVDDPMWLAMQESVDILLTFRNYTALGKFFSASA